MDKNGNKAWPIVAAVTVILATLVIAIGHDAGDTDGKDAQSIAAEREAVQPPAPYAMTEGKAIGVSRSEEACRLIAPFAVQAYIGDKAGRDAVLDDYFIEDAAGLEVPVDQLRHDDADTPGVGFVQVAINDDAASCVVKTASGATWEVHYTDFDTHGYKASRIVSHDEGLVYILRPGTV